VSEDGLEDKFRRCIRR